MVIIQTYYIKAFSHIKSHLNFFIFHIDRIDLLIFYVANRLLIYKIINEMN